MNRNVFFIGSLFKGSTSKHRLNAIKNIFPDTVSLDQDVLKNIFVLSVDRVLKKLKLPTMNSYFLNQKVIRDASTIKPAIIWIDKGLFVYPQTLKRLRELIPEIKLIHYSPDDMMNKQNQTRFYLQCIPLFDLHVTTKSYNVDELYNLGAKKVLFVNNAYAPEIHKPHDLTTEEKNRYSAEVSFIGAPEKERAESILEIANAGIKIVIWGNGWSKFLPPHQNILIKNGWFADEEYSKIICASKINLAFLRKVNRDLQTTRTMEIPACGGFMLAEKTDEHLGLFKEDEEAAFFSDNEELKNKIEYYLRNDEMRKKIAENGLKRCIESGYDNVTMVKKVLGSI